MRQRCDETGLQHLAQALACIIYPGDLIALYGDLGTGKTTFSRQLITALLGHAEEIPSPTFSLVQTYEAPRLTIAHFDLYRLSDPSEAQELGLDDAIATGMVLMEWPQRATALLPASRLELYLTETNDPLVRDVELRAHGDWHSRLDRFTARMTFLQAAGWGATTHSFLQGDASTRSYVRLDPDARQALPGDTAGQDVRHDTPPQPEALTNTRADTRVILMDSPPVPDGPPLKDGLPYSRIAHLAESIRPFVAIATALRAAGLSAPKIYAHDLEAQIGDTTAQTGFLILEDLGDKVFGTELMNGNPQAPLWRSAVDVLVALRAKPPAATMPLPDGTSYALPRYDYAALSIETQLLLDWYWPAIRGEPASLAAREGFDARWRPLLERLQIGADHWVLRDFHSPNLITLGDRRTPSDIGIIDFQDALRGQAAYDLVSLCQDARVDVSAALEAELYAHYIKQVAAIEPDFDPVTFAFTYAALGAQRATKIIGIFARLANRDAKPIYLAHIPRIWTYLQRNLEHAALADLKDWYDNHFPRKRDPSR